MVRRATLCTTFAAFALVACGEAAGDTNAPADEAGAGTTAASSGSRAPAVSAAGRGGAPSTGRAGADASTAGAVAGSSAGTSASTNTAGSNAAAGSGGSGAAGAAGSTVAGGAAAPARTGSGLKPVTSVAEDGPYATTVDAEADGGDGYLVYPTDLGADGVKHPIFVWGTGSGSIPMQYNMHLVRLASHGFVVYSADTSSVTGALLTQGIDYLFAENAREGGPLYQKLDTSKLGVGGHSLGSLSTYDIAEDDRITTTVHVDGGQFDGMGGPRLHKPALFICGEDSWGTPNCNNDYEGASVPIFYTRIAGLIGAEGHIMAADAGLEVWLAWLRWQLAGEEDRRKDFLDPMCTYCTGKYDSQSKNW